MVKRNVLESVLNDPECFNYHMIIVMSKPVYNVRDYRLAVIVSPAGQAY